MYFEGNDLHHQAFLFMLQLRQVIYTNILISYLMSHMISYPILNILISYVILYPISYPIFNIPISYMISYVISYLISYMIFSQAGLVQPLKKEAAVIITASEAILKQFASRH
jgi:hypothetical protein